MDGSLGEPSDRRRKAFRQSRISTWAPPVDGARVFAFPPKRSQKRAARPSFGENHILRPRFFNGQNPLILPQSGHSHVTSLLIPHLFFSMHSGQIWKPQRHVQQKGCGLLHNGSERPAFRIVAYPCFRYSMAKEMDVDRICRQSPRNHVGPPSDMEMGGLRFRGAEGNVAGGLDRNAVAASA